MNMLLTHTLSDFYFFFKKGAGHTWESRNGAGEKATLCRRDAVSGVVSQAAPTRCWRRDAGWILELVGGSGHLGDTSGCVGLTRQGHLWALQGADGSRVGAGRGCWVQLSRCLAPRVGRGQPSPRMDAPGRGEASCKEPAPVPAHKELQLLQKAERRKFKPCSPAGTQSCRRVPLAAAGWDALALHCHPQPCKPSEQDSPCSYPGNLFAQLQPKKIVNEKTRWKRGSKLNATAVMLHLSCEGKIKFCLPLEVSSGKIISSLAKWHHIVSSFQPAASLVSRSIFFQENTRVT